MASYTIGLRFWNWFYKRRKQFYTQLPYWRALTRKKWQHTFFAGVRISIGDKGNDLQINNDTTCLSLTNYPHKPLLFYIRDHELYCTALCDPRYNESAIFIDYHEWYLSADLPFYQYLKLIKAYHSLIQVINNHPVLIALPMGYAETLKFYGEYIAYWKIFEPYVTQFVKRIIPHLHIYLHDYLKFCIHAFSPATSNNLPILPYNCLHISPESPKCNFLLEFVTYVNESTSPPIQESSSSVRPPIQEITLDFILALLATHQTQPIRSGTSDDDN